LAPDCTGREDAGRKEFRIFHVDKFEESTQTSDGRSLSAAGEIEFRRICHKFYFLAPRKETSMSKIARRILLSAFTAILISAFVEGASAQTQITGTLPDGATYVIDVPENWNHELLLYSHGYVAPGSPNPAYDYGELYSAYFVYTAGYALAGSSYATTGWAVQQAIPDQIATLDVFESYFGTPTQTIAWGGSMGGLITAALVQQYPARFSGAMPMCGVLAGGVGFWNELLDEAFAFNTLLAGNTLQVVNIADPGQNYANAVNFVGAAQATAQGRARIALVSALADVPGWYDPSSQQPAPNNYTAQQSNQYEWLANAGIPFAFYYRSELETRAGGNPSFNTGVNYKHQLMQSPDYQEVQALYVAAGLSLNADLATLNAAQRISPDPDALTYLSDNIIFNGQLTVPVISLHTTGDGLVPVEDEKAYATVVREAGESLLEKDTFVNRAGHCEFTSAEIITVFQNLQERINTGQWQNLTSSKLNGEATGLGKMYNAIDLTGTYVLASPQFLTYNPEQFLRLYDAFTQ
jgi:pimeloyl-ACP methyl ester carboxylesterase